MSLRLNTPLPDLSGATEWLNGRPDSTRLAGRAALVYFWSVSCHLCHENMPVIAEWRERYAPHGVQFIAIHVPRQAADMDVERRAGLRAQGGRPVRRRQPARSQAQLRKPVCACLLLLRRGWQAARARGGGDWPRAAGTDTAAPVNSRIMN
jgi:thiol-disulfide isomerase/thioredoxin